ncbi:MAG: RluA family pseudouridine synthase [Oligoflexales bacterium]
MTQQTKQINLTIRKPEAGLPIDKAILAYYNELSRKKLRRILDMGGIKLNGKRVLRGSQAVETNDQISLLYNKQDFEYKKNRQFSLTSSDILYESKDLLAINKVPLLPSQASRSLSAPHVETIVEEYFKAVGHEYKHYLCHRLDKETSGILLLARSEDATAFVMQQFKDKQVKKTYLALCYGIPKQNHWTISKHLSPIHKKTGLVHVVHSGGKASQTSFKLIEAFPTYDLSLIECSPQTGRSHQIRVHLEASKLPIIGDKKYGLDQQRKLPPKLASLALAHHFLHAAELSFKRLDGKTIKLTAPQPPNFKSFLHQLSLRR